MATEPVEAAKVAPETPGTAPVVEAPVSGEVTPVADPAKQEPRVFTQADVDAMIGKRLAREERKWQREQQLRQPPTEAKPAEPPAKPTPEKFSTTEEYIEAVADWKADQKFEAKFTEREKQHRETQSRTAQAQAQAQYTQREAVARVQYADFDDVVYDPQVPISEAMAATIQHSERGPDIAYHLGKNPQEAARIAALPPFLQAKELGRIEAKLPDTPPPARQTAAPEPIPAGKARGAIPPVETTDPRSVKQYGNATEWINADRARQRREWEARNR